MWQELRKWLAGRTPATAPPPGVAAASPAGVAPSPKGASASRFGFQVQAPRTPAEQKRIVSQLLSQEINPQVAAHAGRFTLLDVRQNSVFVRMEGRCQGCGMASATLRLAVEKRLREVLPELVDLVDETDHAAGQNPYFTPSKK